MSKTTEGPFQMAEVGDGNSVAPRCNDKNLCFFLKKNRFYSDEAKGFSVGEMRCYIYISYFIWLRRLPTKLIGMWNLDYKFHFFHDFVFQKEYKFLQDLRSVTTLQLRAFDFWFIFQFIFWFFWIEIQEPFIYYKTQFGFV